MSVSGKMEIAANSATILVAALLSAVLIKIYFFLPPTPPRNTPNPQLAAGQQATAAVKVGDSLKGVLPDTDWRKDGRMLILAISTRCHFCKDSAPFLRTLAAQAGKNVKIIAVLPEPAGTAEKYLQGEGVRADHAEQLTRGRIGVIGTPTLILADAAGVVRNVWVGAPQPAQQRQVLAALAGAAAQPLAVTLS